MSGLPAPTSSARTLQVIGAGFSRTGTVSFTLAIERLLHGPVQHGSASVQRDEAFIQKWIAALDPNASPTEVKRQLEDIHAGYVGTTDVPAILFVKELVELFPDSKVVCTTREPDKWWASLQDVVNMTERWWITYLFSTVPVLRFFNQWTAGIKARQDRIYPPGTTLGPELLEIHYNYLREVVPPERLFFFSVKDGWEPLCKFLNCPIPDVPFPHANDKAALHKSFNDLLSKAFARWAWLAVSRGAGLFLVFYLLRKYWQNN